MGDVHCVMVAQALAPPCALRNTFPVSPSTPTSRALDMNQTMGFAVPSVVVAMGPGTSPDCAAHQAMTGFGGEPPGMRTAMTTLPVGPPLGQAPLPSVPNVT